MPDKVLIFEMVFGHDENRRSRVLPEDGRVGDLMC